MALALAYNEFGAGPPVLILHGLLGSARNWQAIAKRLAATHHVYTLDLRNHGASPWADAMSYHDLAEDVRGFIEQHGLEPVTVLGHSMGGKAAMVLALEHASLIEALIVVDVAPVAYEHSFLSYVQAMQDLNLAGIDRRHDADAALRNRIPDAGTRMFLLQNLVFRNQHFDWRINLPALAANMNELVGFPATVLGKSYRGRTLFLYGSQSAYIQPEHHAMIDRLFPRFEIQPIADAGHWVHVDQPERLLHAVTAFLDDSRR